MATRGISGRSDGSDGLAALHPLAAHDVHGVEVAIAGVVGVAVMVDEDIVAVASGAGVARADCCLYVAAGRCDHWFAAIAGLVEVPGFAMSAIGRGRVPFTAMERQVVGVRDAGLALGGPDFAGVAHVPRVVRVVVALVAPRDQQRPEAEREEREEDEEFVEERTQHESILRVVAFLPRSFAQIILDIEDKDTFIINTLKKAVKYSSAVAKNQ